MANKTGFPIEFAVTPRFDLFYALYTLTGTAPTKLEAWKNRALLRVPRDFERVAKRVAPVPLFWPLLADSIQGIPGELSFDEVIAGLRALPGSALKENVLAGIFHDREIVESLVQGRRTLRQILADDDVGSTSLLTAFGLRPYASGSRAANAIASLVADADAYRDELVLILQRFWQTGFRRDWAALEPKLRAAAFRMKEQQERESFGALTEILSLPIRIDADARRVVSKSTPVAEFEKIDRCYVMPSAFNAGRWWARYESAGGRVRLYFPVATPDVSPNDIVGDSTARQQQSQPGDSSVNAELVFRALGDTTRYAIASILAQTPTTSADLSRRLDVSKPTITHHIHALRAAGLILSDSQGGAVQLSLNTETIRRVSDAAVEQLFSGNADRELATTRKRRK
jgi:DNA-binding transcriptional ArsR family regulator